MTTANIYLVTSTRCFHFILLDAHLSSGPAKTIHIVVPPLEKGDQPRMEIHTLYDQNDLKELLFTNRASLFVDNVAFRQFDDLVDGGTYTYGGEAYQADKRKQTSEQVNSKMVEIGCGLAVRNAVRGTAETAHTHFGHVENDDSGRPIFEIDALIVHSPDASRSNTTAYVVETANAPQPKKVEQLLATIEKLKQAAASPSSHFHNCTTFVPVLGGRYWSPETTAKCKEHSPPIWRVKPSGALFEVRRTLSTSAIKGVGFFLRNI